MNAIFKAIYNNLAVVKKLKREITGYPRRERVIDVGCGTGRHTGFLAAIAGEVVGIDADAKKIETARREYPQIKFYHMDAAGTEFSDGQFDTAFLIMFLHEALNDEVIREVCRIAGEVVVVDYSRVLYGLMGKFIRMVEKGKYERYAEVNLPKKFAACGFTLIESRSFHPNYYIYFFRQGRGTQAARKTGTVVQFARSQDPGDNVPIR
jgi:ubiquinone/menaquinone biosynthesis C-methylase UbiE